MCAWKSVINQNDCNQNLNWLNVTMLNYWAMFANSFRRVSVMLLLVKKIEIMAV